jgi:hypothetical protein
MDWAPPLEEGNCHIPKRKARYRTFSRIKTCRESNYCFLQQFSFNKQRNIFAGCYSTHTAVVTTGALAVIRSTVHDVTAANVETLQLLTFPSRCRQGCLNKEWKIWIIAQSACNIGGGGVLEHWRKKLRIWTNSCGFYSHTVQNCHWRWLTYRVLQIHCVILPVAVLNRVSVSSSWVQKSVDTEWMTRFDSLIQKSQQDTHVTEFILSDDFSTCVGYDCHPSSGAQTNRNYSIW